MYVVLKLNRAGDSEEDVCGPEPNVIKKRDLPFVSSLIAHNPADSMAGKTMKIIKPEYQQRAKRCETYVFRRMNR